MFSTLRSSSLPAVYPKGISMEGFIFCLSVFYDKVNTEIATPRKMNSAKKSTSKGKGTPKIETPSLNDKPVATETPAALDNGSDDSDSEETTVPSKAAHGQEPHLKSTPAADLKSGTSSMTDSDAAQHNKYVPGKTPAAAITKPPSASNGKAVVKSCNNESSESSDETDIEKQSVAVTPSITAPSIVAASKEKTETPSMKTQPKMDSSESSESESEEEPVKPVPTPAASQVKAAMPLAKTTAAQVKATKGKSVTKDVTPASQGSAAVCKTPAKTAVDESSEESDSEEELVPSTPRPAAPSSGLALKQKMHLRPTPLKSKAGDSSASSETDSEEEPVRQNQKTTTSPKKGANPATCAKAASAQAAKPATVVPAGAGDSESSDSSDSESEVKAPEKAATDLPASNVRTSVPSASQKVATLLSAKARTPLPALADDTSETDDSESDEEPGTKKISSQLQASNMKTPSTSAATGKTKASLQTAAPAAESSETDDSDSDEDPVATKTASQLLAFNVKTPSAGVKQPMTPSQMDNAAAGKAGNLLTAPTTADESSDDSDSEEDQGTKVSQKTASSLPASSVKTPSTAAKQPMTRSQTANAAAGNLQKVPTTGDDSSETDDSDGDEDQGAKKTPSSLPASSVKPPSTAAKQPVTPSQTANAAGGKAKTALPADDSSETEDSDSDHPLTKVPTPAIAATKVKSVTKPTALTPASKSSAAAVRSVTKKVDDERSEDSDSEDEPSSAVKASGLTTGTPSVKQSAATTARVPDSDADSESSDSSDTEQKMGLKTSASQSKTAPTLAASVGKTIVPGKRIAESKPSLAKDRSETSKSSEENNTQPAVGASKQTKPTLAAKGKRGISAASQSDEESSSEDSDADTNEPVISTPKTKVTVVTSATPSAAPFSPTKEKTPASGKVTAAQKPSVDSSETSDSSDDEIIPPAQALKGSVTTKQRAAKLSLQSGVTANSKAGSPAKAVTNTKPAAAKESSGSGDSSDRKEEQAETLKKTNVTALKKHMLSTPIPLLTSTPAIASPAKDKAGLSAKSPKAEKTAREFVTESSASESDGEETKQVETPAPTPAKTTVKKGKGKLAKTPTPAKVEVVKSTGRGKHSVSLKQVTAKESSETSESNSSDDKAAKALKSTPIVQTKLDKFFAKRTITPAKKNVITTSTASNGGEEPVEKEATATPTALKTPQGKLSGKVDKTPKTKVASPTKKTAGLKQMAAESSNESSGREDDLALKAKVQKVSAAVTKQRKSLPELKSPSPVKKLGVSELPTDDDGYSDSEEERINNSKVAYLMTTPGAYGTTDDEVSEDEPSKPTAPGKAAGLAEDTSVNKPEKSQDLLQAQTPIKLSSAKRKRTKEDKTTPAKERITKPSKKKPKVQTQPETKPTPPAPTTPGGLLESEEETVLALLEGRSPKKTKKKSSKKTAVEATIQDVIDKSFLPLDPSAWVLESPSLRGKGDKNLKVNSPAIPELSQLSAKKKSGKKRKSSSEDGLSKQKDKKVKKAKKEKKDKKVKTADITGDAVSPKPSKKEKKKSGKDKKKLASEKKDKEKKKLKKKEIKKLAQSLIFAESTDSGVSLQSKPKKKKKVKGDKTTD